MPAPIERTLPVMAKDDSGTTNTVSPLFVANATASGEESMGGFRKTVLVGGLAVVLASAGPAPALEMRPILTLDVARKIRRWMSDQGATAGMEDAHRGARHRRQ